MSLLAKGFNKKADKENRFKYNVWQISNERVSAGRDLQHQISPLGLLWWPRLLSSFHQEGDNLLRDHRTDKVCYNVLFFQIRLQLTHLKAIQSYSGRNLSMCHWRYSFLLRADLPSSASCESLHQNRWLLILWQLWSRDRSRVKCSLF